MKKVLALALALVLALGCASFAMAEEEKPLIGILAPATTHGWVGGVAYFAEQAMKLDLSTAVQQGSLTGRGDGVLKGYKWGSSWNYFYEAEDILPTLNALVNPYTRDLTLEDMDILRADSYYFDY